MPRMRPTVLLFDIDGTLISTNGAGRRSMEGAFERYAGRRDACTFPFGGMTDRAIVRAGLEALGRPRDDAEIDAVLALYLQVLEREITTAECLVHRGVEAALDAAAARPGYAIGLGTGNLRDGARLKLGRVGLFERFAFGGFGCDHERRDELLRIGAARGAAALGAPIEACRVVVIGDTPKDVAAAHAIGAESIAVATGPYREDALAEHHPTRLFADLAADGALSALLG
jgi:phosphoglycolate phosphatase-like HAD superfamily hydrolase